MPDHSTARTVQAARCGRCRSLGNIPVGYYRPDSGTLRAWTGPCHRLAAADTCRHWMFPGATEHGSGQRDKCLALAPLDLLNNEVLPTGHVGISNVGFVLVLRFASGFFLEAPAL